MKAFMSGASRLWRRSLAALTLASLFANGLLVPAAFAQKATASRSSAERQEQLGEEQRIVHVLNRLGFGARPGDVERVRQIGLEKYIEQQLNPTSIPDAVIEAKLGRFPTLRMSNAELLAKYPSPGALIRQMQRRGELPPELAEVVRQRAQAPSAEGRMTNNVGGSGDAQRTGDDAAMRPEADGAERRQYRQAIAEYMREQGLQRPQRVMQELQAARILRAVYSERQLQEVMVDFWSNHFNVYAQKGADRWFLTSYDRDVIRPNALGNFRTLLEATAKSPAMLFYLDNFQSRTPNQQGARRRDLLGDVEMRERRRARRQRMRQQAGAEAGTGRQEQAAQDEMAKRPQQRMRRGINENYARELMELHTLGVEGGYTQKDVQEVARAFTGWTIRDPRGYLNQTGDAGTFVFNSRLHDAGEKVVLGHKIPAGGGIEDGQRVLDILVRHPSTAKFIATKLARRFVSDEPPPALVARVAAAFRQSDGDIRATLRALFTAPEFFSTTARRAKIKTPFEYAVSAVRTLGAETDARPAFHQWIARMGEPLYMYQAPTGYPDTAEHWVNTGALVERLNFALALVSNNVPGTRVDLSRFVGEEAASARSVNRQRVVDRFLEVVLQGDVSPKSREVLMRQLSEQAAAPTGLPVQESEDEASSNEEAAMLDGRAARRAPRQQRQQRQQGRQRLAPAGNSEVARIAALVIGSPEFQRQ
jgi:uncharacterized protein (DUF1800 family)